MRQTLLFLGIALPTILFSQPQFTGIYKPIADSLVYLENLTYEGLEAKMEQLHTEKFHLSDLNVYHSKDTTRFWAVCRKAVPKDTLQHIVRWDSLIFQKRNMAKEGYVMHDIAYYRDGKDDHFIAFWRKGRTTHKVWKFDSREAMLKKIADHNTVDLFLQDVEPVQMGTPDYTFLAIFHRGTPRERNYLVEMDSLPLFMEDRRQRMKSGYRIQDFETFEEDGKTRYMAVYTKGSHPEFLEVNPQSELPRRMTKEEDEKVEAKLFDLEVENKQLTNKKRYKFKFKYDPNDF
ncbi:MAG: hypothetical protein MRY78_04970 [Saprospiraceae bacterium]|nr:hypothetical protein [Saprospiraceae bacterium]